MHFSVAFFQLGASVPIIVGLEPVDAKALRTLLARRQSRKTRGRDAEATTCFSGWITFCCRIVRVALLEVEPRLLLIAPSEERYLRIMAIFQPFTKLAIKAPGPLVFFHAA